MCMTATRQVISKTRRGSYGILTALAATQAEEGDVNIAMFIKDGSPMSWQVPDMKLFQLLLHELYANAITESEQRDRLWIRHTDEGWVVTTSI